MNTDVTIEERLAIAALIVEYGYLLDHQQADRLHTLVTEDYLSTGPMGRMEGREALRDWGTRRLQNPSQVRHVLSNIRVQRSEGGLAATSYYVAYRDTHEDLTKPASVGEYHDRFRLEDGRWKLASREVTPVFTGSAPRPTVNEDASGKGPK